MADEHSPDSASRFVPMTLSEQAQATEKRQKAVAIEYDAATDSAPRITASGAGHIAEQILQIAFANNVKVREDADLVEILSAIEVDSVIPLEAYAAVGEILTYVYKANAKGVRVKTKPADAGADRHSTPDDNISADNMPDDNITDKP